MSVRTDTPIINSSTRAAPPHQTQYIIHSPAMPTPNEIKTALQIAGENKEIIAISVYNQLQGIAKQDVWIKRDRTLIYTADLDLDTIDQAILDIITGDFALFCLEQEDDGVDLAKANLFDTYVLHVLAIIKSKLETLRPTNPQNARHSSEPSKRTLKATG